MSDNTLQEPFFMLNSKLQNVKPPIKDINIGDIKLDDDLVTFPGCIGKENYYNSGKTNWYGFHDKPISSDTRCEYCAQHLKAMGVNSLYQLITHSPNIDCDSLNDITISGMDYNDIGFSITSLDKCIPYLVNPDKAHARKQGVLVVEMPSIAEYAIHLTNNQKQPHTYFSFTMKIGDKDVVINNRKLIYYSGGTYVTGFKTSTNDNFKFVANTPSNGKGSVDSIGSNIITILVKTYRREMPKPLIPIYSLDYLRYGRTVYKGMERMHMNSITDASNTDTMNDLDDNIDDANTSDAYNVADDNSYNVAVDDNIADKPYNILSKFDRSTNTNNASTTNTNNASTTNLQTAAYNASTLHTVIGGRTETGTSYVSPVDAIEVHDKFTLLDSFSVTIQLIHVMTPTNVTTNASDTTTTHVTTNASDTMPTNVTTHVTTHTSTNLHHMVPYTAPLLSNILHDQLEKKLAEKNEADKQTKNKLEQQRLEESKRAEQLEHEQQRIAHEQRLAEQAKLLIYTSPS